MTAAEIAKAEDDANRIVWEDRPVAIRFATAEEAAAMPLRKESGRTGSLRLIDVTGYDLSACGGTHVERTGGIGVIAIGSVEKFKGGSRIEFLCGGRALQRFRVWRGALSAMQKHLSVPPIDMAPAIERMQEDAKAVQRSVRGFQEKLAIHEAQALLAGGGKLIAEGYRGLGRAGAEGDRACRDRRAAGRPHRAVYVGLPRPSGRGARRQFFSGCGGAVEAIDGGVRREGWRKARSCPGRRAQCPRRRADCVCYFGAILSAPSRRITSPFSISFSTM